MLKIADETDPVTVKTVDRRNESSTRTLDAVRDLAPTIRAAANQIEQGRRLPLDLVREMQQAGVFRMAMPRAWGGPELNLLSQLQVIEALSVADASAGWCAMIGTDGGYLTAYIDQAVAREMYADIDYGHGRHIRPARDRRQERRRLLCEWPMAVRQRMPTRNLDDWPFRRL